MNEDGGARRRDDTEDDDRAASEQAGCRPGCGRGGLARCAWEHSGRPLPNLGDVLGAAHLTSRRLGARGEDIARSLVLLDTVVAVTGTATATLTQFGTYEAPSFCGAPFVSTPGRITLRLRPEDVGHVLVAEDARVARSATTLHLFGHDGAPVHSSRLVSRHDRRVLDGLGAPAASDETACSNGEPVVVAHEAVGAGGAGPWEEAGQLAQFDAILADGGLRRRRALAQRYEDEHRRIDRRALAPIFHFLCSSGLPIGVGVVAPAAMHLTESRVYAVDGMGERISVALADSTLEIDPAAVGECLLVRTHGVHGPTWVLEIYDEGSRCRALVTQFGIVSEPAHRGWQRLAESLPPAG